MNAADQQYLIEVISQLKLAQQNQEQAQKDLELWIKRMELAKQARDRELWEAAREKALEAEEKVRKAESVVMELEVEREISSARPPSRAPTLAWSRPTTSWSSSRPWAWTPTPPSSARSSARRAPTSPSKPSSASSAADPA